MNQPNYNTLLNNTNPLDELIKAMGFPSAAKTSLAEVEQRAMTLAQEIMISFPAGNERDTLIQNLEGICTAVKMRNSAAAPRSNSAAPPVVPHCSTAPPKVTTPPSPTAPRAAQSQTSPPAPINQTPPTQKKAKGPLFYVFAGLIFFMVICSGLVLIVALSSKPPDPSEPPSRPESRAEQVAGAAAAVTNTAMKPLPGLMNKAQKSWKEFNIPDDANRWIWIHIKEGNYETSQYESNKGYTSFKACLKDVNPKIIYSTGLYSYKFDTNEATFHKANYPEVTGDDYNEQDVHGLTLIAAAIESQNACRVSMIKDLVAKGSDVNQRFGPLGKTALMFAAEHDDQQVIEYLVRVGAQVDAEDLKGAKAYYLTQSESLRKMLK